MFYLHDEPHCLRFALVGQLETDELRDLEASWRTAESIRDRRDLIVDLSRLAHVDEPTRTLLERLRAAGATFRETPPPGDPAAARSFFFRRVLAFLSGRGRPR